VLFRSLGTIVEDVKFAAGDVKQSFLDDLHDAQDGRMFFMDTTMTRTLSLRPDDFVDFVEETTGRIDTHPPTFPPILALLAAVFAISSHGTALTLQHGVAPALKLYWRMSAVAALLFLVVIVRQSSFPRLNTGQWTTVVVAITCFTVQNLCFVTALSKTTIGNTVIFANSQAVLLLMGKILTGSHVVCMEGIGALVASSGAIVCASSEHNDNDDKDDNGDKAEALIGDFYALASAFCGVGYLTFAKSARSTTSVTMFTFLMMFGGSFLILFYIILVGEQFTLSMNPTHGLFGWMEGWSCGLCWFVIWWELWDLFGVSNILTVLLLLWQPCWNQCWHQLLPFLWEWGSFQVYKGGLVTFWLPLELWQLYIRP